MSEPQDIITYCHIGKVGGKQLQHYLRSHFGYRYRCVDHAVGKLYTVDDLKFELSVNPSLRYIGGHDVRPFLDFGELDTRLKWFSFFREPKERILSHYYQQVTKPGVAQITLLEWMDLHPNRAFWNVYMIAGENSPEKAIEIIKKKFSFVGLTARYEESLLLFAEIYGLRNFRFINQSHKAGPEKLDKFAEILEYAAIHDAEISKRLVSDIKLYRHVLERYEHQVSAVGESTLAQNLESVFKNSDKHSKYNINNIVALGMDHMLWRNLTRLRRIGIKN